MAAYADDQVFTSRAEVEKILTRLGVSVRVQNEEPEGEDIVTYYVGWATGEVFYYLHHAGTLEALAVVPWVREQATIGAAFMLTTHGGEPGNAALGALWAKAEEKLEKIRTDKADVPGLTSESDKGGAPVVSNLTVDMRRQPAIRLNRPASTGHPQGYPIASDLPADIRGRN